LVSRPRQGSGTEPVQGGPVRNPLAPRPPRQHHRCHLIIKQHIISHLAQRPDGEVAFRLLEDVGAEVEAAIEVETGRLSEWLGDVRVTPRFRTPLERELST
jgi:hypothetical protein